MSKENEENLDEKIKHSIDERANKIVDKLCAAYGTDTGIVFGIQNRSVIEAIVKFTIEEYP